MAELIVQIDRSPVDDLELWLGPVRQARSGALHLLSRDRRHTLTFEAVEDGSVLVRVNRAEPAQVGPREHVDGGQRLTFRCIPAALDAALRALDAAASSSTEPELYRAEFAAAAAELRHCLAAVPDERRPSTVIASRPVSSRDLLDRAVDAAFGTPEQWAPHVWGQLAAQAVEVERGEREASEHEVWRGRLAVYDAGVAAKVGPAAPGDRDSAPLWLRLLVDAAATGDTITTEQLIAEGAPWWVVERVRGTQRVIAENEQRNAMPTCSCPRPVGRNPQCDVHGDDQCTCDDEDEEADSTGGHRDGNPFCPRNQR